MSHFNVLVIGDDIEKQLAPYHEFECTGRDDEYVQNVDRLDDVKSNYETHGKDKPLAEFVEGWYGWKPVAIGNEPDLSNGHKYGWFRINDSGELIEAIDRTNPNKKWDWYKIGGRWRNWIPRKGGGDCDSCLRRDFDIERKRNERGDEAADLWDHAYSIHKGESWRTWESLGDMEIEAKRKAYWDQEPLKAMRKDEKLKCEEDYDQFQQPREAFVQAARDRAVSTYAIVKDGKWFSKGEMGWFGISFDEVGQENWNAEVSKMLDELPGDTLLTVVDCHI